MVGLTLEATGCQASIGDYCDVITGSGLRVESEVVKFSNNPLYLIPTKNTQELNPSTQIIPQQQTNTMHINPQLLNRIINNNTHPLNNLNPLKYNNRIHLTNKPINP